MRVVSGFIRRITQLISVTVNDGIRYSGFKEFFVDGCLKCEIVEDDTLISKYHAMA